jgi:hypothetical protein
VVGIWFYEEEEADKVETLLQRILAGHPSAVAAAPSAEQPQAKVRIYHRCKLQGVCRHLHVYAMVTTKTSAGTYACCCNDGDLLYSLFGRHWQGLLVFPSGSPYG